MSAISNTIARTTPKPCRSTAANFICGSSSANGPASSAAADLPYFVLVFLLCTIGTRPYGPYTVRQLYCVAKGVSGLQRRRVMLVIAVMFVLSTIGLWVLSTIEG